MWPRRDGGVHRGGMSLESVSSVVSVSTVSRTEFPLARAKPPLTLLLKRLRWPIRRRAASHLGGAERSHLRGPGPELAELREYVPGDDVRQIDWHATARADRPFVRLAEVERGLDALLVVDLSRSVDWGTARCHRRERAVDICAAAGELLIRQGNRLGLLPFAETPLPARPPRGGRRPRVPILKTLRDGPGQPSDGPTDLAAALRAVEPLMRRRGLILVVSDFLAPDGWQVALGRLAARHEVVAVHLADPRDRALPDLGLVTFEDPETGRQLTVDTADPRLRARFAQAAASQLTHLRAALATRGVDLLELTTAEDITPALIRFLDLRKAPAHVGSQGRSTRPAAPTEPPDLPPAG
jgi:uncharacterized protein (DUF58 family)